jgi:lipopolysaccharide export system permease protein
MSTSRDLSAEGERLATIAEAEAKRGSRSSPTVHPRGGASLRFGLRRFGVTNPAFPFLFRDRSAAAYSLLNTRAIRGFNFHRPGESVNMRLAAGDGNVGIGLINRMILAELVKVFLLALTALTGLFVVAGLIQEATEYGLSPMQIIAALPLMIPNMLPYTIPATTLFATCVVYARLAADNEVLVLRSVGANIYHLLGPAIGFGLLTTLTTAALYYDPIPSSQRALRDQFLGDAEGVVLRLIQRDGGLKQGNLDYVVFVREVHDADLLDVVVKRRKPDRSGFTEIAWAKRARLSVAYRPIDPATEPSPYLPSGARHELIVRMYQCIVIAENGEASATADYIEFVTPLPDAIFGKDVSRRPSAQTWKELFHYRGEALRARAVLGRRLQELESDAQQAKEPDAKRIRDETVITRGQLGALTHLIRGIDAELQMRPVVAFSCLCFALVGCPAGIGANRREYLGVFVVCFLPIVFCYYPILTGCYKLAIEGKLPPTTTWTANAVVALTALFLIRWLMKR